MNDGKIEKNPGSKIFKKSKENEKIILKPMKYIKVTTYEDCFQIMNPLPKTVERLSKLPFKPKSQESFLWLYDTEYIGLDHLHCMVAIIFIRGTKYDCNDMGTK